MQPDADTCTPGHTLCIQFSAEQAANIVNLVLPSLQMGKWTVVQDYALELKLDIQNCTEVVHRNTITASDKRKLTNLRQRATRHHQVPDHWSADCTGGTPHDSTAHCQ